METKEDSESAADGIFIVPRRSRIGLDFVKANETRKLGKVKGSCTDFPLQAFAEEKLVKKEYKEMVRGMFEFVQVGKINFAAEM